MNNIQALITLVKEIIHSTTNQFNEVIVTSQMQYDLELAVRALESEAARGADDDEWIYADNVAQLLVQSAAKTLDQRELNEFSWLIYNNIEYATFNAERPRAGGDAWEVTGIYETALKSIAANSCCPPCREAALVAQAAIEAAVAVMKRGGKS